MLKEINSLGLFFEDCYREISVREYARELGISPPTASKILKSYTKEGLLKTREDRGFLFFRANKENSTMGDFSVIYWKNKLSKLLNHLQAFHPKSIILFGSLAKLEAKKDSDIDLVVLGNSKKITGIDYFERELKREIQIMSYESLEKINKELRLNIINGRILEGYIS